MATVGNTASSSAADIFSAINGSGGSKATQSNAAALEDKFLTLLMTQIKNQDPLNPMDNAQVTTQLAQLNTVNGIEKLNSTLAQLLSGFNEAQGMQAASIIGKNVMVAGNTLPLANGKAYGAAVLDSAAEAVTVTVKDADGKVVTTQSLGPKSAGNFLFSWDGKDANGNKVADGNYSFAVDAMASNKKVSATAMKIGTVSAVTRTGNGFVLDLGSLGTAAFKDVQEIL